MVHVGARAHVFEKISTEIIEEFRRINTEATLSLAKQAIEAGVKRFIFISSIKVLGEKTKTEKVLHT